MRVFDCSEGRSNDIFIWHLASLIRLRNFALFTLRIQSVKVVFAQAK